MLTTAVRHCRLNSGRVQCLTAYQWDLIAQLATKLSNRKINPPGSQTTVDLIVANIRSDEMLAAKALEAAVAAIKRGVRKGKSDVYF